MPSAALTQLIFAAAYKVEPNTTTVMHLNIRPAEIAEPGEAASIYDWQTPQSLTLDVQPPRHPNQRARRANQSIAPLERKQTVMAVDAALFHDGIHKLTRLQTRHSCLTTRSTCVVVRKCCKAQSKCIAYSVSATRCRYTNPISLCLSIAAIYLLLLRVAF